MKDVIATGNKNNRLTTAEFSEWLTEKNQKRQVDLFGVSKYIMNVEAKDGFILVTTFNGSIYSLPFNDGDYNDLIDLVGYKVTLYPKKFESYELEAYFLWNWDKPLSAADFGFLVTNKVVDILKTDFGALIIFANGDNMKIPFKDYEKPHFRASKRMHGDDSFQEGYCIDFDSIIDEMKSKFLGKFVVYSTNLKFVDVAEISSFNGAITTYEETAHYEWAEKDKFKFRMESGRIIRIGTWDAYSVPIYLEDGRIMCFRISDYLGHIDKNGKDGLIGELKNDLQNQVGRLNNFTADSNLKCNTHWVNG